MSNSNLNVYWTSITEVKNQPRSVILFGKVIKTTTTCAVVFKNMPLVAYVVPQPSHSLLMVSSDDQEVGSDEDEAAPSIGTHTDKATEVVAEATAVVSKLGMRIASWSVVERNYAFDLPDVPHGAFQCIKLVIDPASVTSGATAPPSISGRTFTHIIGLRIPIMTSFVVKNKLRGPEWLLVVGAVEQKPGSALTWCAKEYTVDCSTPTGQRNRDAVVAPHRLLSEEILGKEVCDYTAMEPCPPLSAVEIEVRMVEKQSKTETERIAAVSIRTHTNFRIDVTNRARCDSAIVSTLVNVEVVPGAAAATDASLGHTLGLSVVCSEWFLISDVIEIIRRCDPDIIIGASVVRNAIPMLTARGRSLGVRDWQRLCGRIRGDIGASMHLSYASGKCAGVIMCDVESIAEHFVHVPLRTHSAFDIMNALEMSAVENGPIASSRVGGELFVRSADAGNPRAIGRCIKASVAALETTMKIVDALDVLSLTRMICELTGHIWDRCMSGKRAEQVDYMLSHEFYARKFIMPDPKSNKPHAPRPDVMDEGNSGETVTVHPVAASFVGGLNLEPKVGLTNGSVITLLDFKSMYPSLIIGHDICLTTLGRADQSSPLPPPCASEPTGIIPQLLLRLVATRRSVKTELAAIHVDSIARRLFLETRQVGLKLVANELYGYLGFDNARYGQKQLASMVAALGRNALERAKNFVCDAGFEVIYGDSDSLMVVTKEADLQKAKAAATKMAKDVTDNLGIRGLELAADKFYSSVLIITKKKYAALDANTGQCEFKGMDLVRRDWCPLVCDASRVLASMILHGSDATSALTSVTESVTKELHNPDTHVSRLAITKRLKKSMSEYPANLGDSLAHVQAARASLCRFNAGDFVSYVMTTQADAALDMHAMKYSPAYIHDVIGVRRSNFAVAYDWYEEKQIHPVLSRTCKPCEVVASGVDAMSDITPSITKRDKPSATTAATRYSLADIIEELKQCDEAPCSNPLVHIALNSITERPPEFSLCCPKCQQKGQAWSDIMQASMHMPQPMCCLCSEPFAQTLICEKFKDYTTHVINSVPQRWSLGSAYVYLNAHYDRNWRYHQSAAIPNATNDAALAQWILPLFEELAHITEEALSGANLLGTF